MTDDPRTFDYSSPRRSCDVVMKGGITSGVVYPHAVCELARTYRLCSVGGTSAGAIAASVAGAAELGRASGGFAKLAALPSWISSDQHLFELYDSGQITYEDALRNADSVNELRLMIKLNSKEAKDKDMMGGVTHLNIV